jgi:hypothetical protein
MSQSLLNFGERRCGYQVYATLDSGATDFAVWRFWWAISAVRRIGYTKSADDLSRLQIDGCHAPK